MREIEITIDAEGNTEIDLKGFHGKGCKEITDELVKALSGSVSKRTQKAEFYKPEVEAKVKQRTNF